MANFDNIKLEKGLYTTGKSFTQALEEVDPSENYKGTAMEGLDAFQRQLKRYDIKVSGALSDTVSKFFATTDSAALFPEYISRAVAQGMTEANVLDKIVATVTNINSFDYRTITSDPADDDLALREVAEGTEIPETSITVKSNLVSLKKRGRMLVASYEALKFQRLDVFTVMLKQIGAHIAKMQLSDAVNVLISGDGNSNAADFVAPATGGTLTYSDLVKLWSSLAPYNLSTIVTSSDITSRLLNIPEFKDSVAGHSFHSTGNLVTPMGADLVHSSTVPIDTLIAFDKNYALEMVKAGDVLTEHDKLIDRQLERTAVSCITGFAKIFKDASKIMNI